MKRLDRLHHQFVEFIPSPLQHGTLYVSMEYATASHLCCCGCGERVVTPISPTDWSLIYNGDAISLRPSIGNWGYKCRSHYWIKEGRVVWAGSMSKQDIEAGRRADRAAKIKYFGQRTEKTARQVTHHTGLFDSQVQQNVKLVDPAPTKSGPWFSLKRLLMRHR